MYKKFLIIFVVLVFNCTTFVLSPGVSSDSELPLIEVISSYPDKEFKLSAFLLSGQNLELALYDLNNFTNHNPDFTKNLKDIVKKIYNSNFVILLEVSPVKKNTRLDELINVQFYSSDCNTFFYEIYRYDYIQFYSKYRIGQREITYPTFPHEKYQFELEPKLAHVDIKDLPRKRILLYSDESCSMNQLKSIHFKMGPDQINSYSILLKPRV
ncbi:hypothetical protein JWG40_15015 [Leptospira sp. 201903074]|uniref:hypothetical protein n=1 Tax=Leptospira abararensis TaxID=2810036 RepID=UPI001963F3C3|nr:hypothetical protein [Leptospira abararensis]MBM9548336.1 hypothetical protein [Leptospira abararensis]